MITPEQIKLQKTNKQIDKESKLLEYIRKNWGDIEEYIDRRISKHPSFYVNDLNDVIYHKLHTTYSTTELLDYLLIKIHVVYDKYWNVAVLGETNPFFRFTPKC